MWEIDEKMQVCHLPIPKNASSIAATQLSQIQTNYEKRGCIFSDFSIIHSD